MVRRLCNGTKNCFYETVKRAVLKYKKAAKMPPPELLKQNGQTEFPDRLETLT